MRPSLGTEYLVRTHDHGPIHLAEDLYLRGIAPAIEHMFEAISALCAITRGVACLDLIGERGDNELDFDRPSHRIESLNYSLLA